MTTSRDPFPPLRFWLTPIAPERWSVAVLLAAVAVAGDAPAQAAGELDRFVAWGATIELEETDAVIHVAPNLTVDDRVGFIVADTREAQVRLYDLDGTLLRHFGRRGGGPGEYEGPVATGRLPTGELWVVDIVGRVTLYTETADSVVQTLRLPIMPAYGASLLSPRSLLVVGRVAGGEELLHVVDLDERAVIRRMFPLPARTDMVRGLAVTAGFAGADIRADTVAAVFAFADSIFLFRPDGRPIATLPAPLRHFRPVPDERTRPGTPAEFRAFAERYSTVTSIHWLRDGSFLVQYMDLVGGEPVFSLARVSREGQLHFDARGTPRLLAVHANTLYFLTPGADYPNSITTGVLSP